MQLLALILSPISLATITHARKPSNAVLLSNIKSLTFHAGKLTTARRVDPIRQLNPVGGAAAHLYTPETIRCTNSGSSYSTSDIEWTCTASLPPEFKLGSTDVVCEGYENADDDYILKGSCGLEYRLVLTEAGEAKYGREGGRRSGNSKNADWSGGSGNGDGEGTAWIFWIVFIGVVLWMAYSYFKNRAGGNTPGGRGTGWGGFGGGGGNDHDSNDPPPPYDAYPPKPSPNISTYASRAPRTNTAPRQQQQQGWRPGFWTGAAAGAAGGYLAGNRLGGQQQAPQMQQTRPVAQRPTTSNDVGPSYSQERYTSTGFGSTQRR